MKKILKAIVVAILARQVRSLRQKHDFITVGVVGGIGKTSTKLAISQLLGASRRVRYQKGNYNDIVSVPLIFFGHAMPSLLNPIAWVKLFLNNARQIRGDFPFDVVVIEAGTDRLGHIAEFGKYLQLDYAVITAIVPEHMEFLHDMQSVANEELAVTSYSKQLMYNADLVPKEHRGPLESAISYGKQEPAQFQLQNVTPTKTGFACDILQGSKVFLHFEYEAASEVQLYSVLAAVVVGYKIGLNREQILTGIAAITPVSGRLQRLRGINDSIIIDDTYNALPDAVKAGLKTLYGLKATQKIAILGNMNQLGKLSPEAHTEIGKLCDPAQLQLVVTIGPDANKYLAPAAAANGCSVQSFKSPYEVADYLRSRIKPGTVIFAKGSQDKVYTEEAIKPLLADPQDAAKLVRQSAQWLALKQKNFQEIA